MAFHRHPSATRPSDDQIRWDARYRNGHNSRGGKLSPWVEAQQRWLDGGRALDVACGVGRHSHWLACLGYEVDAVDVSSVALLQAIKVTLDVPFRSPVHLIHADLNEWRPQPAAYDLVFTSLYFNRSLIPALFAAVKPGGLCLHTTFHTDLLKLGGDFNPSYLLQPGELLAMLAGWDILAYEERRLPPGGQERDDCMSSILARR